MRVAYTGELVAHIRHRYENTDDTLAAIARETGVSERSINRMRDREGWARRSDRPLRGLPPAMRLLKTATAMAAPAAATDAIERIERLVEKELAAEERGRAQLGDGRRAPAQAERTARTLATLTQTLHALQRLRCGLAPITETHDDDDIPADIDEFRRDLARRIDAFVASRTGASDADGDRAAATLEKAP
jgi:hypothetical protein